MNHYRHIDGNFTEDLTETSQLVQTISRSGYLITETYFDLGHCCEEFVHSLVKSDIKFDVLID